MKDDVSGSPDLQSQLHGQPPSQLQAIAFWPSGWSTSRGEQVGGASAMLGNVPSNDPFEH